MPEPPPPMWLEHLEALAAALDTGSELPAKPAAKAEDPFERLRKTSAVLRDIRETSPAWLEDHPKPNLTLIHGGRD